MKRPNAILFYILGIYALVQFIWWGYHLIELTEELKREPTEVSKRVIMIMGEGFVFFMILIAGLWKIRRTMRKELELTRQQNNFMLSVTHELKTPLAATKLYLQTLQKRELDTEKRTEILSKAIQENDRLEILIDNILNASRLENHSFRPVISKIDVSALINRIADRFDKRNVKPAINREIAEGCVLETDEFMLDAAVSNLIENALKYAGSEGIITVKLHRTGDNIVISVEDQGPGIPHGMEENIFKKFFRAENEETRSIKGSGLGLYIASEFIRILNGKIVCRQNMPKGAIFEITL